MSLSCGISASTWLRIPSKRTGEDLACEQALLFGQAKRASREHASEGPFLCPSRVRRSLARSRETRFTLPNTLQEILLAGQRESHHIQSIIRSPNALKTLHNVTVVIETQYTTNLFIVDIQLTSVHHPNNSQFHWNNWLKQTDRYTLSIWLKLLCINIYFKI